MDKEEKSEDKALLPVDVVKPNSADISCADKKPILPIAPDGELESILRLSASGLRF